MGLSFSSRRRHDRHRPHHHHHPSLPLPQSSSSSSSSTPSTLPPPPTSPQPPPPTFSFAANAPYPTPHDHAQSPYAMLPPPSRPPLISYSHQPNAYNYSNYARPLVGQSSFHPYYSNQSGQLTGFRPPAQIPPAPYVDHQSAKKIKNDVNVHKDTIKIELDEKNPDCHLVSFTFDAMVDGRITISYVAKEGANCTFTPLYPEISVPVIPFQKGLGQKFCQPSGSGVDLGFFDLNDLSKPSPGEDVFPLVISAESCLPAVTTDVQPNEPAVTSHAQITQAVIERNNDGHLQVKVIKQILWVDGVRYELRDLYGISKLNEETLSENDPGKECVICMTEPKDTAVLPCRHMCMCSECAKALRLQSDKCPICRQPIQELLEIKIDEAAP